MTEDEIKNLEQDAMNHPIDPIVERSWLKDRISDTRRLEHETMCAFKFHKFMGKPEQMKANEKDLREIRAALDYLEKELARCNIES